MANRQAASPHQQGGEQGRISRKQSTPARDFHPKILQSQPTNPTDTTAQSGSQIKASGQIVIAKTGKLVLHHIHHHQSTENTCPHLPGQWQCCPKLPFSLPPCHLSLAQEQRSNRIESTHMKIGVWQEAVLKRLPTFSLAPIHKMHCPSPMMSWGKDSDGEDKNRCWKIHTKDRGSSQTSNLSYVVIWGQKDMAFQKQFRHTFLGDSPNSPNTQHRSG